jgi:hypothetical protein
MASEATSSQIKAYLSFYDSSGNQSRLEQLMTGSMTSPVCHFLANEETNELLLVTERRDTLACDRTEGCSSFTRMYKYSGSRLHCPTLSLTPRRRRLRRHRYALCFR